MLNLNMFGKMLGNMLGNMLGKKSFWSCLGLCVGLLTAPTDSVWADPTLTFSSVFSFDLNTTAAGVVQAPFNGVNYLYGTAIYSSRTYGGAIYRVGLNGGAPQTIYQLKDTDGYNPTAGLSVVTDTTTNTTYLYGATIYGPRAAASLTAGTGTLFRVKLDGTGYTTLHTFDLPTVTPGINSDGAYPNQALIDGRDGYVYGVTSVGGANGTGTVFRMRLDGSGFQKLHDFAALDPNTGLGVGGDGAYPSASLLLASDGRLYGVTSGGGTGTYKTDSTISGAGTVYSLTTDGSVFQTIYSFSDLDSTSANTSGTFGRNSDGAIPKGALLEVAGQLIGTANIGGEPPTDVTTTIGYGTVFSIAKNGTGFATLHAFTGDEGSAPIGNLLVASDNKIYGVTVSGTNSTTTLSAYGTVYSIDTPIDPVNVKFNMAYGFNPAEASSLTGGLIEASDTNVSSGFYGTAAYSGACTYYGVVYRLSLSGHATTSSPYSNCTDTTSGGGGGGSMTPGWLWLLAALGLAPPIRRRVFTF